MAEINSKISAVFVIKVFASLAAAKKIIDNFTIKIKSKFRIGGYYGK